VIYDNSKEEGGTDSLITLLRGSDPNPRKCSGEKQFPIPVVSVLHEDGVRMAKVVQTQVGSRSLSRLLGCSLAHSLAHSLTISRASHSLAYSLTH
jgi:hypothetical protein